MYRTRYRVLKIGSTIQRLHFGDVAGRLHRAGLGLNLDLRGTTQEHSGLLCSSHAAGIISRSAEMLQITERVLRLQNLHPRFKSGRRLQYSTR